MAPPKTSIRRVHKTVSRDELNYTIDDRQTIFNTDWNQLAEITQFSKQFLSFKSGGHLIMMLSGVMAKENFERSKRKHLSHETNDMAIFNEFF